MNFSDLSVRKDLPYPEPVIPYPNPVEAKKLMNDYGGRDSETTAILQYVYQSYVLSREFPEFSKKLAEIAACEMKHQKILGTAIAAYGSFPVIGGRTAFWNGSYSTTQQTLLNFWNMIFRANCARLKTTKTRFYAYKTIR